MDGLLSALRSYQQADEEGIMCIVSRQAVEEAADEIERLRANIMAIDEMMDEAPPVARAMLISLMSSVRSGAR